MGRERVGASWRATRAVLAQTRLRRAELAFFWALTGEWALTVALAVVAYDDGGAAGVGLIAVARMIPSAVGTPVITAYADRFRRERSLAAVSLVRTVTLGAAGLVLAADGPHAIVYALVIVATIAFTMFRPTHSALQPLLCAVTSELASANVVRGLLESLATLAGPVVAGALLAWSDPAAVFGAAAVASLLAAGLLLRIGYDAPEAPATERVSLARRTAEGFQTVRGHPDLRWIFALGLAQTYVRGALNVFIAVIALDLLDLGDSGVAGLSAAVGVGGLIGAVGVTLLAGSRHLGAWFAIALATWGAPIAVVGLVPEVLVAYVLIAVIGLANAVIDVPIFTLPVRLVRDEHLNRVFGLFESTVSIGVAVGSASTPALIGLIGLRPAMVVTGLLLPGVALAAWRPLVGLDRRLAVRDDEIEVLRSTPMLQLLPVPSIEFLASRVDEHRVDPGTVLCQQGEPGDSFFVIAEGSAEVLGDGVLLRTIGAGDAFGEIALLEDVPRTATVRATEEVVVLEIDRDTFLEVVAGHRSTHDAAEAVVAGHFADFHPANVGV